MTRLAHTTCDHAVALAETQRQLAEAVAIKEQGTADANRLGKELAEATERAEQLDAVQADTAFKLVEAQQRITALDRIMQTPCPTCRLNIEDRKQAEARLAAIQGKLERLQVFVDSGQLMKDYKVLEQRLTEVSAALEGLIAAITLPNDAMRVLARWADDNREFREPQVIKARDAILKAEAALAAAKEK